MRIEILPPPPCGGGLGWGGYELGDPPPGLPRKRGRGVLMALYSNETGAQVETPAPTISRPVLGTAVVSPPSARSTS